MLVIDDLLIEMDRKWILLAYPVPIAAAKQGNQWEVNKVARDDWGAFSGLGWRPKGANGAKGLTKGLRQLREPRDLQAIDAGRHCDRALGWARGAIV